MTTPSIVPAGYQGNFSDYLHTKVDRSGAERDFSNQVSVPTGTVVGTLVGLQPFNYGCGLNDMNIIIPAMGTGVTVDIGYVYNDNVTYTNKVNAFAAASTVAAAGGTLNGFTTADGATWRAAADGWIVMNIGGATTANTVTASYLLSSDYDISPLSL